MSFRVRKIDSHGEPDPPRAPQIPLDPPKNLVTISTKETIIYDKITGKWKLIKEEKDNINVVK